MEKEFDEPITVKHFKQFVRLIQNYQLVSRLYTSEEYLENLLEKNEKAYPDFVLESFLQYNRHEKIFNCLTENFASLHKIKEEDKFTLHVMFHIFVFEINEASLGPIESYILHMQPTLLKKLLEYVMKEDFLILITEVTCRIFGSAYTLETIIQPLLVNMKYIQQLENNIAIRNELKKIHPKPVTVPKSPRPGITNKNPSGSTEPIPEPVFPTFTPKSIPKTTYQGDVNVSKKLQKDYDKNLMAACDLLAFARTQAFSCAQPKEKNQREIAEPEPIKTIKAKKNPKFKKVDIKGNATTVMREAAQMVKKCEAEIKKIDNLSNGFFNYSLYEEVEEKERKKIQQDILQNIRKNHLKGLLTREEAILAKKNIIKINREKMEEFKVEKYELNKQLEEWRDTEQAKMKALVEKSQHTDNRAKEAQKEAIEDKHRFVKMLQEETKDMMEKAMVEKERELNRKIELIKDLKALQALKDLEKKKEFDPTETANLGLMCEMSIAELQERLFLLKVEVEEDLKNKKRLIFRTRKQRQELLEQAQQFISQNRTPAKEKSKKAEELQIQDTAEILALRKRIDDARKLRLHMEL